MIQSYLPELTTVNITQFFGSRSPLLSSASRRVGQAFLERAAFKDFDAQSKFLQDLRTEPIYCMGEGFRALPVVVQGQICVSPVLPGTPSLTQYIKTNLV